MSEEQVDRGDVVEEVVNVDGVANIALNDGQSASEVSTKENDEPRIPKSRFDEQISKERARSEVAERRLAELEQQQANLNRGADIERAERDVAELRKQERAALMDGDEDLAAHLSTQADNLNRRIAIAEAGNLSSRDKVQALEEMRMELTIERMEDKYPALSVSSDEYDQDLVDDIIDKQNGLIQRQHMSPSKALAKAVEQVMGSRGAGERTGIGGTARSQQKGDAVARNVAASRSQPGTMKNLGLDSDKAGMTKALPNPKDLTYSEFEKLPEKDKALMRGDYV